MVDVTEARPAGEQASTDREIRHLWRNIFYFSQGDANGLQPLLEQWCALEGYVRSEDLPNDIPPYILDMEPPTAHAPLRDKKPFGSLEIEITWKKFLLNVQSHEDKGESDDTMIKRIANQMIQRDLLFQLIPRRGREPSGPYATDSHDDPHASFIRRFALSRFPAGTPAMNDLLGRISPLITYDSMAPAESYKPVTGEKYRNIAKNQRNATKWELDDRKFDTPTALRYLADAWEANHPGEGFFAV